MSGTWVAFNEINDTGKTKTWSVVTTYDGGGVRLGIIKWYGGWRKYAFFPEPGTLFEPTCLDDISRFIKDQMQARRR